MRRAIKRPVRPALEGLEDRKLLSTTWRGHALPQPAAETSRAASVTGVESGTYSVRMVRISPLTERFHFRGTGTIDSLGPVRVTGAVTLTEDASQAGSASGVLTLTLPGGKGTARAVVSQMIPAHTG